MNLQEIGKLLNSPIAQLVLYVAGVGGFFGAIVFYLRGRRDKKLRFGAYAQTILAGAKSALEGLKVTFNGVPQDTVTVARGFFWNEGREAIRRADIAQADPLRIEVAPGAEILAASVVASTSPACQPEVSLDTASGKGPRTVFCGFEFLNFRDGFVVQLVHNGSTTQPISVAGTIIGAGRIEQFSISSGGVAEGGLRTLYIWLTGIMLLGLYGASVLLVSYKFGEYAGIATALICVPLYPAIAVLLLRPVIPSAPSDLQRAISSEIKPLYPPRAA